MNAYHVHRGWHSKMYVIVSALVLIVVGVLYLGRNLGFVDEHTFHLIVSWQMGLIVAGVVHLIRGKVFGGSFLVLFSAYMLLCKEYDPANQFWPVWFIILGIGILLKLLFRRKRGMFDRRMYERSGRVREEVVTGADGFVTSDVSFGGVKHIVLDPVFKGADLNVSFGSIVLDLRRTRLEDQYTYIMVDASFSGIELYLPNDWNVIVEAGSTLGGIEDNRFVSSQVDESHKLVIRGDVTFSGISIKN